LGRLNDDEMKTLIVDVANCRDRFLAQPFVSAREVAIAEVLDSIGDSCPECPPS